MKYLGGKFRQSKKITSVIKQLIEPDMVYIEPFCGGMNSATSFVKLGLGNNIILSDNNKALINMWDYALQDGDFPESITEKEYNYYKTTQDENNPLTAFVGFGCSFGGKWFGGFARGYKNGYINGRLRNYSLETKNSITNTVKEFRNYSLETKNSITIRCCDYKEYKDIKGQFFYLDPPYKNRTPQKNGNKFNHDEFWNFARELSKNNCVIITEYITPNDFVVLHSFGNTVTRHWSGKEKDNTNEVIVMWGNCSYLKGIKECGI